MGKYINADFQEFKRFVNQLEKAGNKDIKKALLEFLEGLGVQFLSIVEDEIIRTGTVDTRLLLNSFQKGEKDNVYVLEEAAFSLEVGTNVKYASFVNDGHWLNPEGVATRWVPGTWQGSTFIYDPRAKTGMLLKQKFIPGSHYWDSAIAIMERMLPQLMEKKMQQWLDQYFADFL